MLLQPRLQATTHGTTIADGVLRKVCFQANFYSLRKGTKVLWDVKYLCISPLTLPGQLMADIR